MLRRKLLGTFAVTLLAGTIGMAPAATAAAPVPTAAVSAPVATARPAPTAETVTGTVTNAADVTSQFTGAISDPRSGEKVARPTFQRLCEKAGATTASSVSASTDMLITGAGVGAAKLTKAEKFEVEVVDQGEIWPQLIAAGIA